MGGYLSEALRKRMSCNPANPPALFLLSPDISILILVCVATPSLVIPPLFAVIQTSLTTTTLSGGVGGFTLRRYRDVLFGFRLSAPLANSLYFAIGSAFLATLIGGVMAWLVTRTDTPLRGLGHFTAFASFGTPFILYTIGWLLLLGKSGPVNRWLRDFFGVPGTLFNVYSLPGMVLIESFLWSPLVFLMLAASFRAMDPSLEEASAACGATAFQTVRRVSLLFVVASPFLALFLVLLPP